MGGVNTRRFRKNKEEMGMSLIAVDPKHVVFDSVFVTNKNFLTEHPKGKWYPAEKMWVLLCGDLTNTEAFDAVREVALKFLSSGEKPEFTKDEELFCVSALITTPTRIIRMCLGVVQEVLEPTFADGVLDRSWILCQAAKLTPLESFKVMSTVCPTFRQISYYCRITGEFKGAYDARFSM